MKRHERMIALATSLAKSNPNGKWKHGAVFAKGNKVLSLGQNNERPVGPLTHKTTHAEIACFKEGNWLKTPGHLYVSRVPLGWPGSVSLSKPCKDCLLWL